MYSDERRIAALLRELILQSGTPAEAIEIRLGWEPGRLTAQLSQGVSFEALLDILPALDATPGDFFARLYGYSPTEAAAGGSNGNGRGHKVPDRRFDESRRAVKAAIARRFAWKQERFAS